MDDSVDFSDSMVIKPVVASQQDFKSPPVAFSRDLKKRDDSEAEKAATATRFFKTDDAKTMNPTENGQQTEDLYKFNNLISSRNDGVVVLSHQGSQKDSSSLPDIHQRP